MRNGMITDTRGTHSWYLNDQLHRVDGPAVIYANGTQYWYVNDRLHRTDGPAVIYNGEKQWHINGKLHRTDGPAVIDSDGSQFWYLNDNNIPEDDVNQWMTQLDITYPFDEEHQALFLLTFGGK